jgi:hypothetical protein
MQLKLLSLQVIDDGPPLLINFVVVDVVAMLYIPSLVADDAHQLVAKEVPGDGLSVQELHRALAGVGETVDVDDHGHALGSQLRDELHRTAPAFGALVVVNGLLGGLLEGHGVGDGDRVGFVLTHLGVFALVVLADRGLFDINEEPFLELLEQFGLLFGVDGFEAVLYARKQLYQILIAVLLTEGSLEISWALLLQSLYCYREHPLTLFRHIPKQRQQLTQQLLHP